MEPQETEKLRARVKELEEENRRLRAILDRAGVQYSASVGAPIAEDTASERVSLQISVTEITPNHARRFFSYFWGRTDVYSRRVQNKSTGKAGYYPQCDNFWKTGVCPKASGEKAKCTECKNRAWTKLGADQIMAHLRGAREDGSDVIGIYPLFPDGTCRLLVFDFDNHGAGAESKDLANADDAWMEEVNALRAICRKNDVPALVERSRSGKGAHLWIFFDAPILASVARKFGFALLERGAESVNLKSFRFYDRMLPAQDAVEEGALGNLIALPLQGQALRYGNSAFIDENWETFSDQWQALLNTPKLSQSRIERLIRQWSPPKDATKPWERTGIFHREDVKDTVKVTLSDQIYIETDNLSPRLQNQIRRMAAFPNPVFFRNQAIGLSNYANSRFIYLGADDGGYLCISRGLFEPLRKHCDKAEIPIQVEDRRCCGTAISVRFLGELRPEQKAATEKMLQFDCGILSAATAFGKTVVCSALIAQRSVNTLVLLESSALIEQWEKALMTFLQIDMEPPAYQTKSGRIRKRKSVIGVIHGAKDTSSGMIDIAMAGSLCKKGEFHPRLKEYGMVIVDECHHSASDTLSTVLRAVSARYVYGVTATPFRGDGLERINEMLLGPVRFRYTAKEKALAQGIDHLVLPRFTRAVSPLGREKMTANDGYAILRADTMRHEQIAEDIRRCLRNGRTPVVLTKFTDHAAVLYELVKEDAEHVFLLTGKLPKKEQQGLRAEMERVPPSESMLLIATGQLIGEGFDLPRLDTLIMAMPVSWKGVVEQYAGRLNRDYEGKRDVMIYDYVDSNIPVFDRMYSKRLRAYRRIGYQLCSPDEPEKQTANAIFVADTYFETFEKDLAAAAKEIVISSPTLGRQRVSRIIKLLKQRQEAGVKIAVVTWHPDAYAYGKDENRLALMEQLRRAGFHIELMEESCLCYAVIDRELVWYGSMKLLSKDDSDACIMRISSPQIAGELLEMTFGKKQTRWEYPTQLTML